MASHSARWARFLRVKPICHAISDLRFFWYARIRRNVRSYSDEHGVVAHKYSIDRLLSGKPSDRILKLIQPMAVIDVLNADSKILAIGCRFESDMLYLVGHGFRAENVRGFDMVSYSPWIDLGNMHAMPYPDSSWDGILMGWTLAYSNQPQVAAKELLRVTRPGGIIAISVTWYPPEVLKKMAQEGGAIEAMPERIQTVAGILKLFEGHVRHVYFSHDPTDATRQGACMVIFSTRK